MINYLLILSIVFMSGSVIGWVTPLPLYLECLTIAIKICQMTKKRYAVSKRNLMIFAFVVFIFAANLTILSGPSEFWNRKTLFLDFLAIFLCATTIEYEEYKEKYINVMFLISVISLIFWGLSLFRIQIGANIIDTGEAFYLMNPFYIYGWNTATSEYFMRTMRNFATFWEPGCYQAWLNLALFFLLQHDNKGTTNGIKEKRKTKWRIIKGVVLGITIITTKSTTGYLMLIINFCIYYSQRIKSIRKKDVIFIALGIIAITGILASPIVVEKFSSSSSSYISYVRRLTDQVEGIKASLYSPLWGLGMYSTEYYDIMELYGINGNSSGILRLIQETGVPFGLWFTVTQMSTVIKQYNWIHKCILSQILICIMFLVIFSTEPINYTGAFFMMLFTTKKSYGHKVSSRGIE